MFAGMYVKLIAAAIIVAAVVGAVWYVRHLQSSVAELEQTIAVKEASIKQLSASIEAQNAAIDTLKADADKRLAAAAEQIAKAKIETARARAAADAIYKTKPSDPSNLCKSALNLVNQGPAK